KVWPRVNKTVLNAKRDPGHSHKHIDSYDFDLGLHMDFIPPLLCIIPDYFQLCNIGDDFGLELVAWRETCNL
ncbi:hypothetical protein R6Q59_000055, partial [Mikania micrantha]